LANVGVSVPNGFATTAQAYRDFLEQSGLNKRINEALEQLNVDDVVKLAEVGKQIREWIAFSSF
jgi:pyruvate,water dikinase